MRPTQEGWWFLAATLLVGVAATNGGVNLLFLIFGMMIFLILASGVMSELALRDLEVSRRVPRAIHAETPYLMGLAVRNDKRRTPTFSLEIEDLVAGQPVERRCYYLKIPAGRMQETAYRHVLARRGVYRLTGFRLSTRFPFGIIRKSRDVDAPEDVLVYPALVPVPEGLLPTAVVSQGQRSNARKNRSGDFHGLRELRSGDDPRDIHWRTSARRGSLFVRETEDETSTAAMVILGERSGAAMDLAAALLGFEKAVSLAASVALALVRRGYHVGARMPGFLIPPGSGGAQLPRLLRAFALTQVGMGRAEGSNGPPRNVLRGTTIFHVSATVGEPSLSVEGSPGQRPGA